MENDIHRKPNVIIKSSENKTYSVENIGIKYGAERE